MRLLTRTLRIAVLTALVVGVLAGRATAQHDDRVTNAHPGDHASERVLGPDTPPRASDGLGDHRWLGLSLSLVGIIALIGVAGAIWALGNRKGSEREHDFAGGRSSTHHDSVVEKRRP